MDAPHPNVKGDLQTTVLRLTRDRVEFVCGTHRCSPDRASPPIALPEPDGFAVEQSQTWPEVTGRLEYVGGRLEYMPPCGEVQQRVAVDVVTELNLWRRKHPEWVVGGNEAGMFLGGEVRAADAAV